MSDIVPVEASLAPLQSDEEVTQLRRLLADKEHAVLRAALSASEAQQELEGLRSENTALRTEVDIIKHEVETGHIAKLKAQWRATEKNLEKQRNDLRCELLGVRTRWQETQQALSRETRARRSDALKAASDLEALQRDLTQATASAPKAKTSSMRHRLSGATATAAILLAVYAGWAYYFSGKITAHAAAPVPVSATEHASAIPPRAQLVERQSPKRGFQGALSSLNDALSEYPGAAPEDIFKAIRQGPGSTDPTLCAFQWNGGQPALMFGGKKESMESSLTRCAEAVQSLGAPRGK